MPRKSQKLKKAKAPVSETPAPVPLAQDASQTGSTPCIVMSGPPPPDMLEELARGETDRGLLDDYMGTIRILRNDKSFSFREIAEWLNDHGIEVDHNAVYRAYCNDMTEEEAVQEAINEQDRERNESR